MIDILKIERLPLDEEINRGTVVVGWRDMEEDWNNKNNNSSDEDEESTKEIQ